MRRADFKSASLLKCIYTHLINTWSFTTSKQCFCVIIFINSLYVSVYGTKMRLKLNNNMIRKTRPLVMAVAFENRYALGYLRII